MNILSIKVSLGMVFGYLLFPLMASAACSSPSGTEGQLRYNSTAKQLTFCDGTTWKTVGGTSSGTTTPPPSGTALTVITTDNRMYASPIVGANGGYTVTLCSGVVGSACGGGTFAGDGNLVITPAGCTGSPTSPSCASPTGTDNLQLQWKTSSGTIDIGNNFRYGYAATATLAGPNFPVFQYCRNLNYGGFTDWYVPTAYEMGVIYNSIYELGESGFYTADVYNGYYHTSTEISAGYVYILNLHGDDDGGGDKRDSNFFRCVRRN